MIRSQSIQQTYDRCSSLYDLVLKPWLAFGRERAVEILDLRSGDNVLEIGVGTGLNFEFYPSDVRVTGFDYSEGMLLQSQKAREEASCPIDLLQMDVQSMAFSDAAFDRILAAYVMTVVPNTRKAVEELLRIAKPGARVVFINHLRSANPLLGWFEDLFHPIFSGLGLFTLDRDLISILRSCGIENIELESTSIFDLHHIISFTVPSR
ncbi:MAG: methyltransferase domain-containing protein [Candidatus Riflebacteria bacterium]|nr:methyltransferase domain-containing protein [Candidatus Riflebacteria bacterium]